MTKMILSGSLILLALLPVQANEQPPVVPEPVAAVWQEHEMLFQYQDFTTMFSCLGLKSKVKKILVELGAREDVSVRTYGCAASIFEPTPFVNLKLRFSTLQLAAPQAGSFAVDGIWEDVQLANNRPRYISRGDCRLVELIRQDVLPAFAHGEVKDRTTCIPHRLDGSSPNLRVKVLRPAS